jgi:hypothetical protein
MQDSPRQMKDENRNRCLIDLLPPSLWGKIIVLPKARLGKPQVMQLERFATGYVEQDQTGMAHWSPLCQTLQLLLKFRTKLSHYA